MVLLHFPMAALPVSPKALHLVQKRKKCNGKSMFPSLGHQKHEKPKENQGLTSLGHRKQTFFQALAVKNNRKSNENLCFPSHSHQDHRNHKKTKRKAVFSEAQATENARNLNEKQYLSSRSHQKYKRILRKTNAF